MRTIGRLLCWLGLHKWHTLPSSRMCERRDCMKLQYRRLGEDAAAVQLSKQTDEDDVSLYLDRLDRAIKAAEKARKGGGK